LELAYLACFEENPMSKIVRILLLLTVLAFFAVGYLMIRSDQHRYENVGVAAPVPVKTPKPDYKEPAIGMEFGDFTKMCGNALPEDRVSSIETKSSVRSSWTYEYSEKRSKSSCYGTFVFDNGILETISH
jgi:hypothetical protein